jgi:DNA-binding transcriptional LysR family regulator
MLRLARLDVDPPRRARSQSATSLADKVRISQPAVSMSVRRGEEIVKEMGFQLLPKK